MKGLGTFSTQTGTGPATMATLSNTAIGYHRSNSEINSPRAT